LHAARLRDLHGFWAFVMFDRARARALNHDVWPSYASSTTARPGATLSSMAAVGNEPLGTMS
jgi:hypothetical protein